MLISAVVAVKRSMKLIISLAISLAYITGLSAYCVCNLATSSATCRGKLDTVPNCPLARTLTIYSPTEAAFFCLNFDWALALSKTSPPVHVAKFNLDLRVSLN